MPQHRLLIKMAGCEQVRIFRSHLSVDHCDELVQERRNSSALAMELRLPCTNPSICQNKRINDRMWWSNIWQYWLNILAKPCIANRRQNDSNDQLISCRCPWWVLSIIYPRFYFDHVYVVGDIGHFDEDGHFFIMDRVKELIKYNGFQVHDVLTCRSVGWIRSYQGYPGYFWEPIDFQWGSRKYPE